MPGPRARGRGLALSLLLLLVPTSGCLDWVRDLQQQFSEPGEWAKEFLGDGKYASLLVEFDAVQGVAPSSTARDLLEQRMNERLRKPGGITLHIDDTIAAGRDTWSMDDVRDLEKRHRDERKGGGRAVLYVLYVDGHSAEDAGNQKVLGAAYSGSSIVIFQETVREVSSALLSASPEDIEAAVLVHEFGHLAGLVNNGIRMQRDHEDDNPDHGRHHSANEDSVMHWAVERSAIVNLIKGRVLPVPPTQFDADDIADMRAAGGQ